MTTNLALEQSYREDIESIIRQHLPGVEVWAYGSRINGESHEGSDLDLVLRTKDLSPVDYDDFLALKESLTESSIPFLVEVRDWARLPESFHSEIKKEYVVFIER